MRRTVAKTSLYTNPENNLFSVEMNFDEDLIGAKRTERRKGSKIKSEEVKEERRRGKPPPKSN